MKQGLECRENLEVLMECARRQSEPEDALKAHMESCGPCRERWAAERALTTGLRGMRAHASGMRTPPAVRRSLMLEFAATQQFNAVQHRRAAAAGKAGRRWMWSLAAAAMILISTITVRELTSGLRRSAVAPEVQAEIQTEAQQEGFIEVPYAPPLARGELIRVVHTELEPAALASLGVNVDPSWTAELPADLLVGQDGFPRAVRVSDEYAGTGGF